MADDDCFSLLTSFAYRGASLPPSESAQPSSCLLAIPTLNLHLARLADGHRSIAASIPDSWCAREPPVDRSLILDALESALRSNDLRVRLTVSAGQHVAVTTSPLPPSVDRQLKVVIDDRPTDYANDPFLLTKTTHRALYDSTRSRHGAAYEPTKGEPFDVLMYNTSNQITETTIANVALRRRTRGSEESRRWITPALQCGLLNGVRRQSLLRTREVEEGIIQLDDLVAEIENWEMICFNEVRGVYHVELAPHLNRQKHCS